MQVSLTKRVHIAHAFLLATCAGFAIHVQAAEAPASTSTVATAEADRVLERAKHDYPVLATPEGEPMLRAILARQHELVVKGTYASIAMVEAVADHTATLAPKPAPAPAMERVDEALVHLGPQPGFGGCYWKSPTLWSCP